MAVVLAGVKAILFNARRLRVKGDVTIGFGVDRYEPIIGADAPHGFTVTPQMPFVNATISIGPEESVVDLLQETGTLQVHDQADKVYEFREARMDVEGELEMAGNSINARWVAQSMSEILP